mmetsp:Transcript_2795/g.5646  ORF Transcript_2795/g.5646 Transcript_2795/m.5646 type:complete len:388 (-) Transcript_2795:182-1345(-)
MFAHILACSILLSTLDFQKVLADDHYGHDYGSEGNGYVDHHYGDGAPASHETDAQDSPYDAEEHYERDYSDPDYRDYDHHHYDSNYGAGDPSEYRTHGSLVLDDVDSFQEFMAMDQLETAVVAVFPAANALGEDYELEHDVHFSMQYQVFAELASAHSHLFRFGHTKAEEVGAELGLLAGSQEVAVLVAPAALLAKNHPRAGNWLRFPGASLTQDALQTFLFMESAPLVGQLDWRASERAAAIDLPLLVVFAEVEDELHHTYHNGAEGGGGGAASPGKEAASLPPGVWTFDSISDVLRPVGLQWRHDINLLVGDKRAHSYEMHSYGLTLPEGDHRTVGLGIKHGERYYKKVVILPAYQSNEAMLATEVGLFIDRYFDGQLKPEPGNH